MYAGGGYERPWSKKVDSQTDWLTGWLAGWLDVQGRVEWQAGGGVVVLLNPCCRLVGPI